jgi:hypothetical protein
MPTHTMSATADTHDISNPSTAARVEPYINSATTSPLFGSGLRPLVITSVNPFGDSEWQLECANSFIHSGHDVISINTAEEISKLKSLNYPGRLECITDLETGKSLYGKPVPLILPALKRTIAKNKKQHYILTNSDIYYDGRKPCVHAVLGGKDAIALTRVEVEIIPGAKPLRDKKGHYRGGLDIFIFSNKGLQKTISFIECHDKIIHNMAFGIPGWDYMLGGIMLKKLNASIADGNLFQHKQHQQAYANLDDFIPYIKSLHSLECIKESQNPTVAAEQFADLIKSECTRHEEWSKLIELCFTRHSHKKYIKCSQSSPLLSHLPPTVRITCKQLIEETKTHTRSKLLEAQSIIVDHEDVALAFINLRDFVADSPSLSIKTRQLLILTTVLISIGSARQTLSFSSCYPKINSHNQAIESTSDYNRESRLFNIVLVFYSELFIHKIYNSSVAKFIVSEISDVAYLQVFQYQIQTIKQFLK